jgi:signal transduction histidine kinase
MTGLRDLHHSCSAMVRARDRRQLCSYSMRRPNCIERFSRTCDRETHAVVGLTGAGKYVDGLRVADRGWHDTARNRSRAVVNAALRVLVVEDSAADAKLNVAALRKAGHQIEFERVDSIADMRTALAKEPWDVITCDWTMPEFSGVAALALLKETGLDIPFVIVSGTIGEELACDAMRAGANDYILKDRIARLAPAVERELRDARARAEQRQATATSDARTLRETAERKSAEVALLRTVAELNRSNEELGQFAYIASHDLQEPLRMVASYTQLLSKRYKGRLDADADEIIAFAVDGARRMQRLIQDLLAYSRIGTKGVTPHETSSEQAVEEAVANLRGAIEESHAVITCDPLPTVIADASQLIQLFQNIIGNALKYQNPGAPRIHISSRQTESSLEFSVQDNGLGIEAKYFDKIFGMFQRLHKRDEFSGTGIGLPICKKIVERHGGTISVESSVGHGSTFRFTLPAGRSGAA